VLLDVFNVSGRTRRDENAVLRTVPEPSGGCKHPRPSGAIEAHLARYAADSASYTAASGYMIVARAAACSQL
jgi:hypothetical protein